MPLCYKMASLRLSNPCMIYVIVVIIALCQAKPATNARAEKERTTTELNKHRTGINNSRHLNKVHGHSSGTLTPDPRQQSVPRSLRPGDNDADESGSNTLLKEQLWGEIEARLDALKKDFFNTMNEKLARLNNSITIDYLYNVYHYLIEEVELGRHFGEMRAGEIEKVRRIAHGQGKDIVRMEQTLHDLSKSVQNLTYAIQNIQEKVDTMDTPQTGSEATTPSSVQPAHPGDIPVPVKTRLPADCQEVYELGGLSFDGDYNMQVQPSLSSEPFQAQCRRFLDAGWLVIQKRLDGSTDFYRNWRDYKQGFGDLKGEFWLGNQKIYEITNQGDYMLQIRMTDFDGREHYAQYDHFRIEDEQHGYQLHVHGYHGDAGDSLTPSWSNHNGQKFSTYDRDNDDRFYDNCAERFHGAWWFKSCFESHLNGLYYHRGKHDDPFIQNGIQWNTVGHYYSLKTVLMMVKPNSVTQHGTGQEAPIH